MASLHLEGGLSFCGLDVWLLLLPSLPEAWQAFFGQSETALSS